MQGMSLTAESDGHMHQLADLTVCDREPIHTPEAIQPQGALLVARVDDLTITHASANLAEYLGLAPREALGRPLQQILGAAAIRAVHGMVAGEYHALDKVVLVEAPATPFSLRMTAHASHGSILIELEPAVRDMDSSLAMHRVQAMMRTLHAARTQRELCDIVVAKLRQLTGYDRVMVYRFDREGHGEVIAEDRERDLEPDLGLHYPAGDIPRQARQMYLKQRIRTIADATYVPVPLLANPGLGPVPPVDMTFCALRSVAPVHLEYMRNMGVQASLGASLILNNSLWGMLICHHRIPLVISTDLRGQCDLIGHLLSLLLGSLGETESYAEQLYRQRTFQEIVVALASPALVTDALQAGGAVLLSVLNAGGAVIRLEGRTLSVGTTPPIEAALQAMTVLRTASDGGLIAVDELREIVPGWSAHCDTGSGALFLPMPTHASDGIIWFRPERNRVVDWAGAPEKPTGADISGGRLSPRHSFALWREQVRGHSEPWQEADRATARELRDTIIAAIARRAETQIAHMAKHDALTGLPNRLLFHQRLEEALDRARGGETFAVLYLDLDRFKAVNDTFGHPVGDALLQAVTGRLTGSIREIDTVARLGGDEFAVIQSNISQPADAAALAERLIDELSAAYQIEGRRIEIGTSIGVVVILGVGDSPDASTVLQHADMALYSAKAQGRGTFRFFEPEMDARMQARRAMVSDLQQALAVGQFELFYQPLMDLRSGVVSGFEALIRWRHPVRGLVPPDSFIPLAEEIGLIVPLGEWALRRACDDAMGWPQQLKVSVNLSAIQFAGLGPVPSVSSALAASGLDPRRLELEITETMMLDTSDTTLRQLHALKALGVSIAIDDFGTGYSSLTYLMKFPFDRVKIDKSFVGNLGRCRKSAAIVEAVTSLCQTLGMATTVEGVETEAQLLALQSGSCTTVQGYLFSKPRPAAEVAGLCQILVPARTST